MATRTHPAVAHAEIPTALRERLETLARKGDRTLAAEIRRALKAHVERGNERGRNEGLIDQIEAAFTGSSIGAEAQQLPKETNLMTIVGRYAGPANPAPESPPTPIATIEEVVTIQPPDEGRTDPPNVWVDVPQPDGILKGQVPVAVTGGDGDFLDASGQGTLTILSIAGAGTGAARRSTGELALALDLPNGSFDVTSPRIAGATARTVRVSKTAKRVRVTYRVTAQDAVDGPVLVVYTPRSGALFRVGRTTVICSAKDRSANTATAHSRSRSPDPSAEVGDDFPPEGIWIHVDDRVPLADTRASPSRAPQIRTRRAEPRPGPIVSRLGTGLGTSPPPYPPVFPSAKAMRMRGLEPPRAFAHTDLNRARLPIPPHPRLLGGRQCSPPQRTTR